MIHRLIRLAAALLLLALLPFSAHADQADIDAASRGVVRIVIIEDDGTQLYPISHGTGFAVTPYGEWHARELELFVDDLGFSKAAALRAATEVNARFMSRGDEIGVLQPGRFADFVAWDGSPLADIAILQDKSRLRGVYIAGRELKLADRPYDPRKVTDFSLSNWTDLYTRARVAELRGERRRLEAAE